MRNFVNYIVAIVAVVGTVFTAGAFTVDGLNYSVSNNEATLTGATSRNITEVTIPATVTSGGKTYPVNWITYNAFHGYKSIRSVHIDDSNAPLLCKPYKPSSMYQYMSPFKDSPVEEYYIGRNIARGGTGAVYDDYFVLGSTSGYVDLIFGGGITFLPNNAFLFKSLQPAQLRDLTIGGNISDWNNGAFNKCVKLRNLTLLEGRYSIETSKFPEGHVFDTLILEAVFDNSVRLPVESRHIVLGDMWTVVTAEMFLGKQFLETVSLPETTEKIDHGAFMECPGLRTINFPGSLRKIGDYAFNGSRQLADIEFNDGLEEIGIGAFQACEGIGKLTLPGSLKEIGFDAFHGAWNVNEIELLPSSDGSILKINTSSFKIGEFDNFILGRVYEDQYGQRSNPLENCLPARIELGEVWTEVPENMCKYNQYLTTAILPETIQKIGISSFAECSNLTSINFPSSLREIDSYAFNNCTVLPNIEFNDGLEKIGMESFQGCVGISRIVIPGSIMELSNNAFYGDWNVEEIILEPSIDNSPISMETSALGVGQLKSLCLGRVMNNVYPYNPLCDCNPESVEFGEGWTSIHQQLLYNKSALKEIKLPSTLEKIGENAFTACPNIERIWCVSTLPPVFEVDGGFDENVYESAELYIPIGSRYDYESAKVWKNFLSVICENAHLITAVYNEEYGVIRLNGSAVSRIDIAHGDMLEIFIMPALDYFIASATLDGRDVLPEIDAEGYLYVGPVGESHTIEVEFAKKSDNAIVIAPEDDGGHSEIYRVDGIRTGDVAIPGVYIVRSSDGKVSKVVRH